MASIDCKMQPRFRDVKMPKKKEGKVLESMKYRNIL